MTEETSEPGPSARYFTNGDCHQAVHNLTDPAPILAAGFREITEDDYRAATVSGDRHGIPA